jgi:hypothetical protein
MRFDTNSENQHSTPPQDQVAKLFSQLSKTILYIFQPYQYKPFHFTSVYIALAFLIGDVRPIPSLLMQVQIPFRLTFFSRNILCSLGNKFRHIRCRDARSDRRGLQATSLCCLDEHQQ